ncbi:uncharacterized protein [Watersipora subatra]|uniref:uncharacterized protein n=1 Tax=Watersipora subatra TaxID=2589382 RepID=UPI00355AE675
MPLPLKSTPSSPNTLPSAKHRLNLLLKRFAKDEHYKKQYETFMNKIIENDEAEQVPLKELNNPQSWYIPHFGVYHPKNPNKIRVVFDDSSKVDNCSLNDYLLQDPDHINSLIGILMQFRRDYVAIICDIERMFHQFRVLPPFQNYLRFLWFDGLGNIVPYRMKVHLFGARSSPACATYGLRYLADQYCKGEPADSEAVSFVKDNFYVDDGLTSVSTTEDARLLINHTTKLCESGNILLHKFMSNDKDFMKSIAQQKRASSVIDIDLGKEALPTERALGIQWDVENDGF